MFKGLQTLVYGPLASIPKAVWVVIYLWSFFWKGVGLWKSAKNNQKYWFISMLVVNTVGILEIVYLSFFQKLKKERSSKK